LRRRPRGRSRWARCAFLASQAENQLFRTEIADEEAELDDHPEIEQEELVILLREEGLSEQDARSARSGLQVLVIGGASAGVGYLIGTGVAG
jgi:VIT1/CCC1 family predicted Fe2+/Mn2+ transporter